MKKFKYLIKTSNCVPIIKNRYDLALFQVHLVFLLGLEIVQHFHLVELATINDHDSEELCIMDAKTI